MGNNYCIISIIMRSKPFITLFRIAIVSSVLIVICTSFCIYFNSPVKGSVSPANGSSRAWLISRTDTLNAPVLQGIFMITNVKPGNYTLMLEGRPPFRDSFKQDVLVVDGQPTDVGVIEMNQ
jgi:hypothetical protein